LSFTFFDPETVPVRVSPGFLVKLQIFFQMMVAQNMGRLRLHGQPTRSPESLVGDIDIADDFSADSATVDVLIPVIEFQ